MPLRVVMGRANAGKTGVMIEWAFEALDAGLSPTLLVPHLADVRRLQMELARKAPLGVRVATSRSFIEELWQLHGDGRRLVGDATRAAVMRQILESTAEARVGTSATTPGFERLMLRIARTNPPVSGLEHEAENEAGSIALDVLRRYRDALGGLGLIERSWIGGLLREDVPEVGFLGVLRFTAYTMAQTELFASLSQRNTVCVALTWEDGFAPTAANEAAAHTLIGRAEIVRRAAEPHASSELGVLAGRIGEGAAAARPTGQVILGEARGREGETALVARLARRAVDDGAPPERVAIVFSRLTERLGLLRNALAAEELQADIDCPVAVGTTPFGRSLAALMRLGLGRGGRVDALEFLQGPFSDAGPSAVREADRTWRKERQGDDSLRVLEGLTSLGGRSRQLAETCRRLARARIDEATVGQWQDLADDLLSTAVLSGRLAGEDAGAHRAVTTAIAEMASAPGTPFGADDVLDALPVLTTATTGEESTGRVQVVQASKLGARRFDVVIIGGLTEAETPGTPRHSFATELSSAVSGQTGSDEGLLATLEFYSLITRARSLLALVRQTQSSDGAPQTASPLLEAVVDVYRAPPTVEGASGASALEVVEAHDVLAFAPVFTKGRRDDRTLPEDLVPRSRTVVHGTLDPELAGAAASERVFSATEIESYLECPYGWFHSRMLRPREVDAELDAAALGSRAHRLIAKFYEALRDSGARRVTRNTLPAALRLFDRTAEAVEEEMAPPLSIGEEIDVSRARLWARQVVEDDACLLPGFVPHGHEVSFGHESPFEFAGVPIAGRMDRIDVGPKGLIVTDYKSTRDVAKFVRAGTGFGIQHVVYAAAAESLLGVPAQGAVYRSLRTRRMRGFWRTALLDGVPEAACEKDAVDEARYAEIVAMAEESVAGAVEGMRAGRIPRTARSQAKCRYCSLGPICEGARA